jgi:hypothetical protein
MNSIELEAAVNHFDGLFIVDPSLNRTGKRYGCEAAHFAVEPPI